MTRHMCMLFERTFHAATALRMQSSLHGPDPARRYASSIVNGRPCSVVAL